MPFPLWEWKLFHLSRLGGCSSPYSGKLGAHKNAGPYFGFFFWIFLKIYELLNYETNYLGVLLVQ